MPFEAGTLTFSMFTLPGALPENYIELLGAKRAGILDQVKDEPQIGWANRRCILDNQIDEGTVNCGTLVMLALRRAERKIPASMLKAWCQREELVWMRANERQSVPRKVKNEIKEEVTEQNLMKIPPSVSALYACVDPVNSMLYLAAASSAQIDLFVENFYKTFDLEPLQITPEYYLEKVLAVNPLELPIINFSERNDGETVTGRDFLTWLWYFREQEEAGTIEVPEVGEVTFSVEGPLTFALAGEADGAAENTLKNGNSPLRSAEAKAALSVGKKLKKAKFFLEHEENVWSGTFDADTFTVSGMKLPEGEEMEDDDCVEERIEFLNTFRLALTEYFKRFVDMLRAPEWAEEERKIQRWVAERESM